MEVTTKARKRRLLEFIKAFEEEWNTKDDNDYVYSNTRGMFTATRISSGIEGSVLAGTFISPVFNTTLAIKEVSLDNIQDNKQILQSTIDLSPNKLYNLFLSDKSHNQSAFTELISQTLINQLILQKVCPNFSFNYYWEYVPPVIRSYNEYVAYGDFHKWAQEKHSYDMWCNALFQIMVGLLSLKRYFNMLHTDFHSKNILVNKVKPGGYWTYIIDGFKYYLPNLGFQFLIHDFGFCWIPDKLYIKWHYSDTLKYMTKSGLHYYDLATVLRQILETKRFKLPPKFRQFINQHFFPEELNYTLSKAYYKINSTAEDTQKYPNITTSYQGTGTTLGDKIYQIFHNQGYPLTQRIKGTRLESYSLDRELDKSKLPRNLRSLVV